MIQYRDGIGLDFLNPPWPVNFKIYAGRPVFLQKVFVHCSMHLMKNFQKGGMGKVLKFVTPDGRRVANVPTSSGPEPARARKHKPKSCPKKQKIKLGLKN